MKEKLYHGLVFVLCLVLFFEILPTAKNILESHRMNNVTVTKKDGNVEVTNRVDKTTLKVKYTKATNQYTLYKDNDEYQLSTKNYGDDLVVDLASSNSTSDKNTVTGQCPLVIPLILWTPALIEAAEITITVAVATVGTYTAWYTVDSIAKTIESSKADAQAQTQVKEKTKEKSTGYFEAMLVGGKVAIRRQITAEEAVARLIAGKDVFATTKMSASTVAFTATAPGSKMISHPSHDIGEGYYPHFHPGGRAWIVNPNSQPHCWYGSVPQ